MILQVKYCIWIVKVNRTTRFPFVSTQAVAWDKASNLLPNSKDLVNLTREQAVAIVHGFNMGQAVLELSDKSLLLRRAIMVDQGKQPEPGQKLNLKNYEG